LFANSIGATSDELHLLYELHPDYQVFPTYPTVLAYKGDERDVLDARAQQVFEQIPGAPKLDGSRAVDGQKAFKVFKALPRNSDGQLELRKTVVGVYDKGKAGTVVETSTSLVDKVTGEVYTTEIGSGFFVGQGGWGGEKGPKPTIYSPPEGKKPDRIHTIQTSKEAALLYRLNGDYNPLHAEPGPGTKMGFGGVILHGLGTWNMVCHGLLQTYGASQATNLKEFQARFSKPVRPGDVLVTEMWRTGHKEEGFDEIVFITKTGTGDVVLSNGRALVRIEGGNQGAKL